MSNFTDPINAFSTAHNNAKATADGELKPILQLQDHSTNAPVESTKWRNGNLLGATFNKYAYGGNATGNPDAIYLNSTQAISLSDASNVFTNSATSPSATSIVKDTRYGWVCKS